MLGKSNEYRFGLSGSPLTALAVTAGMVTLGLAVYVLFVRFVERRPVSELALPGMGRELGVGLLVGSGLYTACVLSLMVLGIYRIEGLNPASFMLPAVAMALSSGFSRNCSFAAPCSALSRSGWAAGFRWLCPRSYSVRSPAQPGGHDHGRPVHQHRSRRAAWRGLLATRRLWMSMGFQAGMSVNHTQSAVFSGVVSGSVSEPGLIKPVIKGPDVLTGGSFGLESSLIAFLLCTTAGVVLLILAVRRGNIVEPFWRRAG